jgi:hypothetical protein
MLKLTSRLKAKWLVPAILLAAPITAEAEPVTYAYSGVAIPGIPACIMHDSVNGTITLDFANENPAQSEGSVGSPIGWTSVSSAKTEFLLAPYVFTMTVCGLGPYLNANSSSITVGPGGISGQFKVSFGGVAAQFSFSNPSGAVSANGMPLFDSPGTGSVQIGDGANGFSFVLTSLTLVSPSVTRQIDSLVTDSLDAPSLIEIANTAQAQVQSACISLAAFVRRVKAKLALKQLPQHRANQLIFEATTLEVETGC